MFKSYIVLFISLFFVSNFLMSQDNRSILIPDGTPIVFSAVGDSCFGTGQEKHDDGSFENGGGWNSTVTDGRIVLKFRPTSYPWKYNKFCLALTKLAAGTDSLKFDIVIYDTTGAGGAPGTLLGTLANQVAKPIPVFASFAWFSYDISSMTSSLVNNGAIYIGIKYDASPANQSSKFVMIDENAAAPVWPGYAWANAGPWMEAQSPGFWPAYKSWGMRTMGATPSAPVGNTLVLVHDTTITSTIPRKADRDTLNRYLPGLVGNYTMRGFTSSTVFPDLSTFNTIILQETSFDVSGTILLGATARTQIKAWLASGTPASKKSLISIGADQGYNYSRTGAASQDLEFSQVYGKYIYKLDNAQSSAPVIEGVTIDVGNMRPMTITPPGGAYWPDGCSKDPGGTTLYRYTNHTINDTVAGIGNIQPGYLVATLFQDPRYFTGGFRNVLAATIGWVVTNGGVITGINNQISNVEPNSFKLLQNYPNPFNPETKISFSIPKTGLVTLKIYDILGKEVAALLNEVKNAGSYELNFNASNLSSGTYFYRIESGNFTDTKKMFLLK